MATESSSSSVSSLALSRHFQKLEAMSGNLPPEIMLEILHRLLPKSLIIIRNFTHSTRIINKLIAFLLRDFHSLLNLNCMVIQLWLALAMDCNRINEHVQYQDRLLYGFGFDSMKTDYKVVRLVVLNNEQDSPLVEVYSLTSRSWRRISGGQIINESRGVLRYEGGRTIGKMIEHGLSLTELITMISSCFGEEISGKRLKYSLKFDPSQLIDLIDDDGVKQLIKYNEVKERRDNVCVLINEHRQKVAKKLYVAKEAMGKWKNGVGPKIEAILKENVAQAEGMVVVDHGSGRVLVRVQIELCGDGDNVNNKGIIGGLNN
ncbi:hypothetical protein K1719_036587 [Acacia pycnantha]|nr:hypothetical protein K1719_036587 [Acacia pycnantha]